MTENIAPITGKKIHITGVVQGVGFRPFIYGLALNHHLTGWVRNTSAGVDIEVDGLPQDLTQFILAVTQEVPPLAHINSLKVDPQPSSGFLGFEIVHSEPIAGAYQPISADVSICEDCLRELYDPQDRHYQYPFINCTNCGPRFTIIQDVPYDRPKTTMAPFEMCPDCSREYHDPLDRRFHAQPVACPVCGPKIWLEVEGQRSSEGQEALAAVREYLKAGKIIAIKGLGGFHLACDAANPQAVSSLRRRKLRVDKPFALMMPSLEIVQAHCRVSKEEAALLQSRQRPIVVLEKLPASTIASQTAPNQSTLGVMLPYTPLHYLLLEPAPGYPDALVMTSGNLSEEPIAVNNEDARTRLAGLADAFLMHERDIHTRCDDSVVRILDFGADGIDAKQYPLRRSRGYAPFPLKLPWSGPQIFAAGAELKNSFCLTKDDYAFLSHHIGDLENYETLLAFQEGITHFENLFRVNPEFIVCDLHPDYMATRYALGRAADQKIPVSAVQHHHAHIAACMVENKLGSQDQVIGVCFDGTGYGMDGAVWGGEFLVAAYTHFERPFHLSYSPMPGGDHAVKQPWRLALAWLSQADLPWEAVYPPVHQSSPADQKILRRQISTGLNAPQTSSMGRLFDAVAALSGIGHSVNYEAQAAIEFEAIADPHETGSYPYAVLDAEVDPRPLIRAVAEDVRQKTHPGVISARFHNGTAQMVLQVCQQISRRTGLDQVALSGGVWQNMRLLKKTHRLLSEDGFHIYTHSIVPANDGGLSLGQAVIGLHRFQNGLFDPN